PPTCVTSTLSLHDALPICYPDDTWFGSKARQRADWTVVVRREIGVLALVPRGNSEPWARSLEHLLFLVGLAIVDGDERHLAEVIDRKSTRLNSSHVKISYA